MVSGELRVGRFLFIITNLHKRLLCVGLCKRINQDKRRILCVQRFRLLHFFPGSGFLFNGPPVPEDQYRKKGEKHGVLFFL